MTTSAEALDYSTYRARPFDSWAGADETKKQQRKERETARLINLIAGMAAVGVPIMSAPNVGWSSTMADYSLHGQSDRQMGTVTNLPSQDRTAPLPFFEAFHEMASFKNLGEGWDGIESEQVSEDSVDVALAFLGLLPSDIASPEASVSSDGTVDWYWRNDLFAATITFFKNRHLSYYAQTNTGDVKGSFKFNGSIPNELVESLKQL